MNLSQRNLRLFTTTAALGHVSRASEVLHISQPALTRAIKEFESQLGFSLFDRTTRRLALTSEGAQFLPKAQALLRDLDNAVAELRPVGHGVNGHLSLVVGTAFACTVLPSVLRRLKQDHPGIQVSVVDDNSAGITRRVAHAEVDFGIGSAVGDTQLLSCTPLLDAPVGLLANPKVFALKARASVADATRLPLLKESSDTSIVALLRSRGSDLLALMEGGLQVSSLSVQIAFAAEGMGVAVVSALGASHPQAASLSFAPLSPVVRREVMLMRRRDRAQSPITLAFAQTLHTTLATTRQMKLRPGVRVTRPQGA